MADGAVRLSSASGLSFEVNANGSIRRVECGDILLNLFLASEIEGGPANVYLRRHGDVVESTPLLGPRGPGAVCRDECGLRVIGTWCSVRFELSLRLADAAAAWFWHLSLENTAMHSQTVDLIYAQDVGLAHHAAVRTNEYYVSQYVDFAPLVHSRVGTVLAIRQNLPMGERHPWALIGALGEAVSFATDALQLYGRAARLGAPPAALGAAMLDGARHQHEHAMAVLQDARVTLAPGARTHRGFFGWFEADHPAPSSAADVVVVDRVFALAEAAPDGDAGTPCAARAPARSLFVSSPPLAALDLTDSEIDEIWNGPRRQVEREDGVTLSFFTGGDSHVVLREKDLRVLRPHGTILRTGAALVPDERSLTTTAWMCGVFNSLLTQGNAVINRVLSTVRSYLGLFRAHGQRIFVDGGGGYRLLDLPSAFEMTPVSCRWLYKHEGGLLEVQLSAAAGRHELGLSVRVLRGGPCRFLISNHVAINGDDGAAAIPVRWEWEGGRVAIFTRPESELGRRFPQGCFRIEAADATALECVGGDELLFDDGRSRGEPYLVIRTHAVRTLALRIRGELIARSGEVGEGKGEAADFSPALAGALSFASPPAEVACLREILPWLAHDAMIHYLAPRGLEQFSGGGWGTRDVAQGPVEMLLALGRWEPIRSLLRRVFHNQNAGGDWPQWFMFFERERAIRAADSHGDIVFWPLLALASYLLASEDAELLESVVPFFHEGGDAQAEKASVREHVMRALGVIRARVIEGTSLAAYGQGDWDDSLQPADPSMRERLCSSWTVTLQYQTLRALAAALRAAGRGDDARGLEAAAQRVLGDFHRWLVADGVVSGFACFHPDGRVEHLFHPRDPAGGPRYRLLSMVHAIINDMLSPEQARAHVEIIRARLLGPDGARLFDRPIPYEGGRQRRFQRAETSTFFGREMGVMYMHAHLRYAEAMWRLGDADAFLLALRQASPVGLSAVVPSARPRQVNCYYSSSDGWFRDRYEAQARYAELIAGRIPLEGGWRIYSSGAGIALRLIHQCLLGLRRARSFLSVDPVVPKSLDGLRAEVELAGARVCVRYHVACDGFGPLELRLNGTSLPFAQEHNPYRRGGVRVPMEILRAALRSDNQLAVYLQ